MSVRQLLKEVDSMELTEWMAAFTVWNEERDGNAASAGEKSEATWNPNDPKYRTFGS
jgi:hypothetical protein